MAWICTQCGEVGRRKYVVSGSILIEAVLWLLFIIPGLIYTLWRSTSGRYVCPKCRGPMVRTSSRRGRKLVEENYDGQLAFEQTTIGGAITRFLWTLVVIGVAILAFLLWPAG